MQIKIAQLFKLSRQEVAAMFAPKQPVSYDAALTEILERINALEKELAELQESQRTFQARARRKAKVHEMGREG